MTVRGIGIDIADLRRFERLISRHGESFLGRWFSPRERAQCQSRSELAAFAASRFAAKEAVWKALTLSATGSIAWRSIEVLDANDAGGTTVHLSGWIGEVARREGVGAVSATVTWQGHLALAVAIADRARGGEPRSSPT